MSNKDVVHKMYEYFFSGNLEGVRREVFAEDIRWTMPGRHALSGTKSGVDEVIDYFGQVPRLGFNLEMVALYEFGENELMEVHRVSGERDGKKLDPPIYACAYHRLRNGKIAECEIFVAEQHYIDHYIWGIADLKPIPGRLARPSSPEDNKGVLRRHFEEVLNQGYLDVVDEIYTENYVLDAPVQTDGSTAAKGLTKGRDGLKRRATAFRAAFPDIHFTINDMVAEGDKVTVHYTFRGTHHGEFLGMPPTKKKIDVSGILIAHLVNGQIASAWSVFDTGQLTKQLQGS